ncbi:ras guanine nucleotide exchange factor domain-containing protein [Apiospora arundinis]
MESINIACIGANGVGKSHFIQRAIGLPKAPGAQPTAARIFIDNVPYAVTLFELDLEYFDVNPERQIQWPRQIGGTMMPPIDGVLLLYDVMNKESIMELPQTLTALVNSNLPTVLVATKCDNPENVRQVNTEALASACQSCVSDFKTSASKPENSRNALFRLLKVLVANRQAEASGQRRRAASVAHLDTPHDSTGTRPLSQHSKHSRASSDMSLVRGLPPQSGKDVRYTYRSPRTVCPGSLPYYHNAASDDNQTVSSMLRTPGIRLDRHNTPSFLDIEESDGESFGYNDDIPILQRNDEMTFDRPAKKTGVNFEELIDRLLAPKMSRSDSNFADVFLCLYRKFAAPGELFSAILTRLEQVKDDKSVHYLTKTSTQLRIIETVAKWVASYPGDFARPTTRRTLEDFIRRLSCEPIFAAAAQQMRRNLEFSVFEDDDTGWAKADVIEEDSASGASSLGKPEAPRLSDMNESISSLSVEDHNPARRPSATSSLNTDIGVTKVHQFQFHSYEDYEREAATMVPTYTMPLTKFRYHIFMDTSDDDIADEITRIDWVMFSSIRIRDLVRHVSLNAQQREKAGWVANMILMRDKAKHRAQMLEKFMSIALKLRQLNNYNGLAAVLAGINGTAIHRLAQTKALVPADVQKRFARLVLLMGTQKSHFAYRLAWENSPLPRIPFMPLHRRDLVSAEEGSMTFVGPEGDRINWKKFEVLGEVCLPIMKSQGTPYPNLTKHDVARELILDCLMPIDDEDIYQRSVTVESQGAGGYDASKKKFPWFAKQ